MTSPMNELFDLLAMNENQQLAYDLYMETARKRLEYLWQTRDVPAHISFDMINGVGRVFMERYIAYRWAAAACARPGPVADDVRHDLRRALNHMMGLEDTT